MEVVAAASGDADLLMECDEEEQELWPQPTDRDKDEDGEGLDAAVSPSHLEEETEPARFRIIPIPTPTHPVSSFSPTTLNNTVKSSAAHLGFMVNGHLVPLQPGGGGAELKLLSHPGGSASGFTTVQIPVTLTVRSPAGTHHISTTASLTTTLPSNTPTSPPAAPPQPGSEVAPTPIITGVVSGEAAQKVLSDHNVNFRPSPPLTSQKTPPQASTLKIKLSTSDKTKTQSNSSSKPAPRNKLLRKGELGPVSPPDCVVCMSQYKLVTELRGFMCLCSPAIAQSLKNLKRKSRQRRRSREKSKTLKPSREPETFTKVSKTRSGLSVPKVVSHPPRIHRPSDDFLSEQFTNPPSPCTIRSPQMDRSEPLPDLSQGKLVILVEDFYYGSAPGRSSTEPSVLGHKFTGPYRCIHCPKTLRNNIKLMIHMQQHVSMMSQQNGDMEGLPSCPHCFRRFLTPFKLQCHLEAVHSQCDSTATCKICELDFSSELAFLWHMKNTHKPGEMPYVCQVCDFRSSFYSDVWAHFQDTHADTKHMLCQYCLRVLCSNTCYQQHFARHQRKHVFGCDKCRLHFLYVKERLEHSTLHHRTHVRPPQLTGLKAGTKVTVRTYSVVGQSETEEALRKPAAPCKVVDVEPPLPIQEASKRKTVESLGSLLSNFSQKSFQRPSDRCVECLCWVRDFQTHFPSLVHCSLCRFITCCSTSYANHMINNHATCRKSPQYRTIFQSDQRLSLRLKCVSCTFSTSRGDVMANHLVDRPKHGCVISTEAEANVTEAQASDSVTSPSGRGPGTFIPIHLLPSGPTSTQLSVKPLTSHSPLSSPPAMTIRFLGPRPPPKQPAVSLLSAAQLSVVLSSLCHGVSQASRQHHTPPLVIRSWTELQERGLADRTWYWRTDKMAEWVLRQREQQLMVSEDILLQTTSTALGEYSSELDCYSWTVDFLLRRGLGLQPSIFSTSRKNKLPRSIRENSRSFIKMLCSQIQSKGLLRHCVGCMDEFSIFIDLDLFNNQNPAAFQLFGSSADRPAFDFTLAALSDGTFLTPLLFFRGAPFHVPEGFPQNVLLEARQDGFTDQERLQIWIDKVWCPHVACSPALLMVDVHRGHRTEEFRKSLSFVSTETVLIPSGYSCRLQPLDVCVTPVLRDFLQARWSQLVSQGGLEGLGLDQLALALACWLSEVSSTLNSETNVLRRSFISVCNPQHLEDRQEAVEMIRDLAKALVLPLETTEPERVELLLVMEEDNLQEEKTKQQQEKKEELVMKSPTALRQVFEGDSDLESFHGFQDEDISN